jgi:hypothetical protein
VDKKNDPAFIVEMFSLEKLEDVEVKEKYRVDVSN